MKKLVALAVSGIMLLSPVTAFADDDLEARVAALEERVAALEAQLSGSASETEAEEPASGEKTIEYGNCTLEYKDFVIDTDYEGDKAIILYFDFENKSDEVTNFYQTFDVSIFQNGKEAEITDFPDDQASQDRFTDLRPGAAPIRVCTCYKLTDNSDIIVRMEPSLDFDAEPIEFTLSLE